MLDTDPKVLFTLGNSQGLRSEFDSPILAAAAFRKAEESVRPYVVKSSHSSNGRSSASVIAQTSVITTNGIPRYGKWAGASSPEFRDAFLATK